jgi:hypothetical protein
MKYSINTNTILLFPPLQNSAHKFMYVHEHTKPFIWFTGIPEYSKARSAFFRLSVCLFQIWFTFPWINMTRNNPKEILKISYTIFN